MTTRQKVPTEAQRTRRHRPTATGPSRLAQVRLRADEMDALQDVMRTLDLHSTSEALREGLRLLAREAADIRAAEDIQSFYGTDGAPAPVGDAPPTEAELAAADASEW